MTQLPSRVPLCLETSLSIQDAYSIILNFENAATGDRVQLIYARILGYLLLYGPSYAARTSVSHEVVLAEDEDALAAIGKVYFDDFIWAFMKEDKERTPYSSEEDLPSYFATCKGMAGAFTKELPHDHLSAKRNTLARDGFHCVVTGQYDAPSAYRNTELNSIADSLGYIKCVHILPVSENRKFLGGYAQDGKHKNSLWTVLEHFGYKTIYKELSGNKIHRLENVLTLGIEAQTTFDNLGIWFEATKEDNTYTLGSRYPEFMLNSFKKTVTFKSTDPNLPLPSPDYLAIHASCAKVAHFSGAGGAINRILRALELGEISSGDGASANILDLSLWPSNNMELQPSD